MAKRRSGLSGVPKLRRTLRRLPADITAGAREVVKEGAQAVHADMLNLVEVDTGSLASLLRYKVARDGLTARAGLLTPTARKKGFYAKFLEFGTKAYEAGDVRRDPNSTTTSHVKKKIPARAARPFLAPALKLNIPWMMPRFNKAVEEALRKATK